MRRMMHAAILFVAITSSVQAQQSGSLVPSQAGGLSYSSASNVGEGAILHSEYAGSNYGVADSQQSILYGEAPTTHYGHAAHSGVGYPAQANFGNKGACGPFSQIAMRMQCDYSSRNLWATYPQERAALVAHMMQHVDGTCDCTQTYDQACHTGGASCGTGCGIKSKNRYKLSTLYGFSTNECGTGACGTSACGSSACSTGACGSDPCGSGEWVEGSQGGFSALRAPLQRFRSAGQPTEVHYISHPPQQHPAYAAAPNAASPYAQPQQPPRTAAMGQPGAPAPNQNFNRR